MWQLLSVTYLRPIQKTYRNQRAKNPLKSITVLTISGGIVQKRAAIYVRVSTDKQTVDNQVAALRQIAERRGWEVVEQYHDAGISGAKGRDGRPGLDQMLNDAQRRKFDVIISWAIDRLGRSLIDLLNTIETLKAVGVDLYLDQQAIDTCRAKAPPRPRPETVPASARSPSWPCRWRA
jgi:predicted site-specific integrase-resolvase